MTSVVHSWSPILEGTEAEAAWSAVDAIASQLEDLEQTAANGFTLAGGDAGVAVFFAYLYQATKERRYRETALAYLRRAAEKAMSEPSHFGLLVGRAGVAWALQHLASRLSYPLDTDIDVEFDAHVLELLEKRRSWHHNYDLFKGLVGLGVYALERWPAAISRSCLEQIVVKLDECAVPAGSGVTWPRGPTHYFRISHTDLGVARGVPSIIALLSRILELSVEPAKTQGLLQASVEYLLEARLRDRVCSHFPIAIVPGVQLGPAHTAWCYGDPGIAVVLLGAARATGDVSWGRVASELAASVAMRRLSDPAIYDAGLCHGAGGVGHILNRLYHAMGDDILAEGARRWMRHALSMRRSGGLNGGFLFEWDGKWAPVSGLLRGAVGVGLALLAAVTRLEPDWDTVILTRLRGRRGAIAKHERPASEQSPSGTA